MDGTHAPTIVQAVTLCKKAGLSANWLFLNQGAKTMSESSHLDAIHKRLKSIELKMKDK
jgi:hypothetical protein